LLVRGLAVSFPHLLPPSVSLFDGHFAGILSDWTMHNRLTVDTDPRRKACACRAYPWWEFVKFVGPQEIGAVHLAKVLRVRILPIAS
jgi:hypothetical protein